MEKQAEIWAMSVGVLLLIEIICSYFPDSDYCQALEPWICNPEPISKDVPNALPVSLSDEILNSGTTTTTTTTSGTVSSLATTTTTTL